MPLTTLGKVKEYLEIDQTDTSKDSILERLISSASATIENRLRRKIPVADYTEKFYGKHTKLFPRQYPIISVASLTFEGEPLTDYKIRETYIDLNGEYDGEFELSYRAGYETIPEDLEQACIMLVDYYYKTDISNYTRTFAETGALLSKPVAMPAHVRVLIDPYRKVVV
ncbi:MAG: phage gp6-like head-tail connector protein [Thermoanaerobacteraceae bacterium]|nr:phage gp6-like head-tail connector protein [Thermoanaerobacteraceae bacterium]